MSRKQQNGRSTRSFSSSGYANHTRRHLEPKSTLLSADQRIPRKSGIRARSLHKVHSWLHPRAVVVEYDSHDGFRILPLPALDWLRRWLYSALPALPDGSAGRPVLSSVEAAQLQGSRTNVQIACPTRQDRPRLTSAEVDGADAYRERMEKKRT